MKQRDIITVLLAIISLITIKTEFVKTLRTLEGETMRSKTEIQNRLKVLTNARDNATATYLLNSDYANAQIKAFEWVLS